MLTGIILVLAMAQAVATVVADPDPGMFSEAPGAGELVDPGITRPLCTRDEGQAIAAMELAVRAAVVGSAAATPDETCGLPARAPWRVLRVLGARCVASPGAEWCDVEAHAIEVSAGRERRYAVMLLTADQVD